MVSGSQTLEGSQGETPFAFFDFDLAEAISAV